MNYRLESPQILLISLGFCALCSTILLFWGRRLARCGDWLAWIGLAAPFAALSMAVVQWTDSGHQALAWTRGWIGPRGEPGAILAGLLLDGPGLVVPLLIFLSAFVFISSRAVIARKRRPDCAYAGTCASAVGASLAWLASTPWLSLAGWAIASVGGFVALGSGWLDESESQASTRYARERGWALVLAMIGLCGIAITREGLDWPGVSAWASAPGASPTIDQTGAVFLLTGVFFQLQLFPLLGGAIGANNTGIATRGVLSTLCPGVAAFAVLWRAAPFLTAQNLLVPFGIVLMISGALNLLSALVQSRWRQEFYPWIGAGFALCGAILALGGQAPSLSMLVAFLPGAAAIALSATFMGHAPDDPKQAPAPQKGTRGWTLFLSFAGVAAATGMIGFASAYGIGHSVGSTWSNLSLAAPLVAFFAFFAFVGWSLAWRLLEMKRPIFLNWANLLTPLLLVVSALAPGWTGTISGSPLLSGADRTSPAWLSSILPGEALSGASGPLSDNPFAAGSLLCLVLSAAAILGSYFVSRRKEPLWAELPPGARGFRAFLVRGYGIDHVSAKGLAGLQWFGRSTQERIDRRAWTAWLAEALEGAMHAVARALVKADEKISWAIRRGMQVSIEAGGTAVQALQSGSVQWYVMFAIGSSILLLVHFLT